MVSCDIPPCRTPKDCSSCSSNKVLSPRPTEGPSWIILFLKSFIWIWQSGRAAPNLEKPLQTPFPTAKCKTWPSEAPGAKTEEGPAATENFLQLSEPDTAGLCSLAAPACSPWPLHLKTPQSFGIYFSLGIYLASPAKGYPFLVGSEDQLVSTWLIKGSYICLACRSTSLPEMSLTELEVYLTALSWSKIMWYPDINEICKVWSLTLGDRI